MTVFFRALAELVQEHRVLTAMLMLALMAVVVSGAGRLDVDFSVRAFFGGGDPGLERLAESEARWGADVDELLVVVEAPETLLTRAHLDSMQELSEELESLPSVQQVLGFMDTKRVERPVPWVVLAVPLPATLPADDARVEAWRTELLADRGLVPQWLSADGSAAAIRVTLAVDTADIAVVRSAVREIQEVLDSRKGELEFGLAGIPAVRAGMFEVLVSDQLRFVPISIALMILLLALLARSVHGVAVPLVAAVLPAMLLFGLLGWLGRDVDMLNQTYFTLIPVIAVADAIHMVNRFHEESRRLAPPGAVLTAAQRRTAITRTMTSMGAACLLTSVTTAVGFLSLNLATMPILQSFGTFAAVGIIGSYLTALIVVPLGLSLARAPVRPVSSAASFDSLLVRCALSVTRHPWATLAACAAVLTIAIGFGLQTRVDSHLSGVLPPGHPITQGNRLVDEQLGGMLGLSVEVEGPVTERSALEVMLELEEELLSLEGVRVVQSPGSTVARVSQLLGGARAIPESQGTVDRLLGEGLLEDTVREGRGRIIVRSQDVGAAGFAVLTEQVELLAREALEPLGLRTEVTGSAEVTYRGLNGVTYDLRNSLVAAFFIIALLIVVLFRSPRLGLISFVPNALPLVVGYGFLGLVQFDLEPAPAVIFTVALGIAVDDTIHLLARFREELAGGATRDHAIVAAVRHSGRAVLFTSIILAVGFSVNVLSSFPQNRSYGAVGGVVILSALLCDIFVLPALLGLFSGLSRPTGR